MPAENYPFCTIDPSVGVVGVPDARLYTLAAMSESEKTIPAAVEFVDIAGLVKGAAEGEGLGNQFLAHIRETDAIAEVVRLFEDDDVHHVHGRVDPRHDIEVIDMELIFADLATAQKVLERATRDARGGDKDAIALRDTLAKIVPAMEAGKPVRSLALSDDERAIIRPLHFLTQKPVLYVLNKKSGALNIDAENGERWRELKDFMDVYKAHYVLMDAGVESELSDVHDDEKQDFRRELGVPDGIDALIKTGYVMLDLISFFTTGKDESRAWTITLGSTAPEAGAAIHTDFRDKFIRADVIQWGPLLEAGSWAKSREMGLLRSEGREYIVQDGDVMEFKHS